MSGISTVRLHRKVLSWYRVHKRPMPWRDIDNPYLVFISEFMLQQTQASRVMDLFPAWVKRFPDLPTLAKARVRSVLVAWSGFGYNRRALNLHASAGLILKRHDGVIPRDPDILHGLPGIGAYTAHAIACFGYRVRTPVVDVNIRRVFGRVASVQKDPRHDLNEKDAWSLAERWLPRTHYYDWNQALMDLGAQVCTARVPRCGDCPLQELCSSAHQIQPQNVRKSKPTVTPRRIYRGRAVEILRRTSKGRLPAAKLGALVREDFADGYEAWLEDLLHSLERDGLIARSEDGWVELP